MAAIEEEPSEPEPEPATEKPDLELEAEEIQAPDQHSQPATEPPPEGSGAGAGADADDGSKYVSDVEAHTLLTSFSGFLTVCIHSILYYRRIYPPETFLSAKAYNLPVHQNRHPKVCAWVLDAVDAVSAQLAEGNVARVAVVLHAPLNTKPATSKPDGKATKTGATKPGAATSDDKAVGTSTSGPKMTVKPGTVLERWVFDVSEVPSWHGGQEAMKEFGKMLQDLRDGIAEGDATEHEGEEEKALEDVATIEEDGEAQEGGEEDGQVEKGGATEEEEEVSVKREKQEGQEVGGESGGAARRDHLMDGDDVFGVRPGDDEDDEHDVEPEDDDDYSLDLEGPGDVTWTDVDEQLRAAVRRLASTAEIMGPLPDRCTFTVAVELRDDGVAPIGHPQPWIPVEGNGVSARGNQVREAHGGKGNGITPIRAVEAGPLFFECWVEEGSAKQTWVSGGTHPLSQPVKKPGGK